MFVRLVTPPAVDARTWIAPIGIAQLAGVLKAAAVPTHCLDLNPEHRCGEWIPDRILVREPKGEGARDLRREHPDKVRQWAERCLEGDPDLVGLSVLYHGMVVPALALAREIREIRPETLILLGGPFAEPSNSALLSELLQEESIAGIVQGDGEEIIVRIAEALEKGRPLNDLPGMWARDGSGARLAAPNLPVDPNGLPPPDFGDLDLESYRGAWHDYFPVFGSRGCVNRCTFCNSRKVSSPFRQRSAEHLMKEIARDVELYGAARIGFTDNLVNGRPREFKRLCRALRDAELGVDVFGMVALSPSVDEETLGLMAEAGFTEILLAVESPAEPVRRDMGKWADREGVMRIVRGAVERSLRPCVYLMHSFPTEREEDFLELLHFADEFSPSDLFGVSCWPFRLAQVQPGELDRDFVRRFNIRITGDRGFDYHNPRGSFGREPKWQTAFVDDDIRRERQRRVDEHLAAWAGRGACCISAAGQG